MSQIKTLLFVNAEDLPKLEIMSEKEFKEQYPNCAGVVYWEPTKRQHVDIFKWKRDKP